MAAIRRHSLFGRIRRTRVMNAAALDHEIDAQRETATPVPNVVLGRRLEKPRAASSLPGTRSESMNELSRINDAAAKLNRLYREDSTYVLSYVTRLLRDRYLAEDVVQETMLRAWRHRDELN